MNRIIKIGMDVHSTNYDGVKQLTVEDGETFPLDRSIDVSDVEL